MTSANGQPLSGTPVDGSIGDNTKGTQNLGLSTMSGTESFPTREESCGANAFIVEDVIKFKIKAVSANVCTLKPPKKNMTAARIQVAGNGPILYAIYALNKSRAQKFLF